MARTKAKTLQVAKELSLPIQAVTEAVAWLGRRGSGKTYGAGKFAEELLGAGAQVVVVDPIGNWWGLRLAADGKKPGIPIPVLGGDHGDLPLEASVEPGIEPLAHGVPARVGRLRAYGNAIVPQVAAEFVRAYVEAQCS